ncbi:MAG: hypothetical protein K0S55_2051, partial [Clostridia bacterium]|nr:hypothetical protein [Clostridia bacterium]
MEIKNNLFKLELSENSDCMLYTILSDSKEIFLPLLSISYPAFEINGKSLKGNLINIEKLYEKKLSNNTAEICIKSSYSVNTNFTLKIIFRIAPDNPVIRFCYILTCSDIQIMTKSNGDFLEYCSYSPLSENNMKEIRFSEFQELSHSFCLAEYPIDPRGFKHEKKLMGPMLLDLNKEYSSLLAYEHGSQAPDVYIEFKLGKPIILRAVKGNYYNGQEISEQTPYETIWLQFAAITGNEDALAAYYREFQLKYATLNTESRKPYIFYNTWAFQERNKWYNGKQFLSSMNEEHILSEIEIAHRMGIDVFVLDTGWYEKTGEWSVNLKKFPAGLKNIKQKLNEYGMKLGLWFGPTHAADSTDIFKNALDCKMTANGVDLPAYEIWETEISHNLCLVSRYWEIFANRLIELVNELGVSYFKWDAVGQYGCNSKNHYHGTDKNTYNENAECYAFQLGRYLCKIVDKVCEACPECIVDFDITEGGRYVGLGFLSSGKYFLMNNGPYYGNYNIPINNNTWSN